ncbi:MAG: hypothetical protein IJI03_02735, partial [Rudaea sp.]|nr:hypothetical protein [Rudaea sp.]
AADADPMGRMPIGRNVLGRVSLLTFSARAEKVRRSSPGRVEAFALNQQKQKQSHWIPAKKHAGMTSKKAKARFRLPPE